jgi:hypothetical protein
MYQKWSHKVICSNGLWRTGVSETPCSRTMKTYIRNRSLGGCLAIHRGEAWRGLTANPIDVSQPTNSDRDRDHTKYPDENLWNDLGLLNLTTIRRHARKRTLESCPRAGTPRRVVTGNPPVRFDEREVEMWHGRDLVALTNERRSNRDTNSNLNPSPVLDPTLIDRPGEGGGLARKRKAAVSQGGETCGGLRPAERVLRQERSGLPAYGVLLLKPSLASSSF